MLERGQSYNRNTKLFWVFDIVELWGKESERVT